MNSKEEKYGKNREYFHDLNNDGLKMISKADAKRRPILPDISSVLVPVMLCIQDYWNC